MTDNITLLVKDAPEMAAYVSMPDGEGPFPAIIIFQEAFGVNHHIRNVADRFAREGYVAIAPELFHRTAHKGFEISYNDFPSVQPHFQAMTTEGMENDIMAVYDWLHMQRYVQKDKMACIGFCLGGRVSFVANSTVHLQAAISFYGGSTHTLADRAVNMQAPHLFFWGGKDQHIKPEHVRTVVDAMKTAEKDFMNVEISYADHAFFCDERASYNPEAAKESWALVLAFLKNKLNLEA